MKIIQHQQGTPGWHAARAWPAHPASEAAIAMGLSPYKSRTDLLREKATGDVPDVDAGTQARFDAGHATEASARAILEAEIGDELYPVTATDDDGYLLASSDGINMAGDVGFEHKLWSEERAAALRAGDLLPQDWPQAEQNIRVFGLDKLIFVVSDGTKDKRELLEYRAVPGRIEKVMAAWAQFDADLADFKPAEYIPAAVAAPTLALPALSIQVKGEIALIDNLPAFGEALTAFCKRIPAKPSTDQEFADCKEACKRLQEAQDALDAAEAQALGQVATFDAMKRTKAMLWDLARTTRLATEKLVAAREQAIKGEIVQEGKDAFAAHIDGLNKRLGKPYMPAVAADFAGAAKNKRTIASLRSAVSDELARAKIAASAVADGIQVNLNTLRELAKDHAFLFADAGAIVLKAPDDLTALVKLRIAEHQAAEQKRLDAEREKIRAEEAEKLARQQAAQVAPPPTATPAIAPVAAQPAPIIAPPAWGGGVPKKVQRPPDAAIIRAVAQAFGVDDETAMDWVSSMDFSELAA